MKVEDYSVFFDEIMYESDRAAVIIGAIRIENLLKDLLKIRLVEPAQNLFEMNGLFGSFSAKIYGAHAVGIIDKEFSNRIHLIRNFRNDIAHKIEGVDFESSKTSNKVLELIRAFEDHKSWESTLKAVSNRYNKKGNALKVKLVISLVVACLIFIKDHVKAIDASSAQPLFPKK